MMVETILNVDLYADTGLALVTVDCVTVLWLKVKVSFVKDLLEVYLGKVTQDKSRQWNS